MAMFLVIKAKLLQHFLYKIMHNFESMYCVNICKFVKAKEMKILVDNFLSVELSHTVFAYRCEIVQIYISCLTLRFTAFHEH